MTPAPSAEITRSLRAWSDGDQEALERLPPLVCRELHHLAHRYMLRERQGWTLRTTALVNEAYLRLVDAARERAAGKRGGSSPRVDLDEVPDLSSQRGREILALEDALQALAKVDPRKAEIIELRFYGGLSVEETAEFLGLTPDRDARLEAGPGVAAARDGTRHLTRAEAG